MDPNQFLAQDKFDQAYITSTEICQRLNVTRPAIHFRRKAGLLPNVITVPGNQLAIWERTGIEPYLKKWEDQLNAKQNRTAYK